jgi:hypothetical protein
MHGCQVERMGEGSGKEGCLILFHTFRDHVIARLGGYSSSSMDMDKYEQC